MEKFLGDIWLDISTININKEGGGTETLTNAQKPEKLLERIIQVSTQPNDIILDFHLGSGTTTAVAQKMGRQYIGVEQMDYIDTISIERMKKVILGEQGGISKTLDWQGGGSFVYCELAKCNQTFVDEIKSVKADTDCEKLLEQILKTGFISHKVNPADIRENAKEFKELSLKDKKRFLLDLLDKNMLYVNLCDMDDKDYNISKNDKAFTKSFYGKKGGN
jgi:adenine-specific DNA-methyltransferase